MLSPIFVTGRTCFLVCMTVPVAAVGPSGRRPRKRSNDVDDNVTQRHWRQTRRLAFVSQRTSRC